MNGSQWWPFRFEQQRATRRGIAIGMNAAVNAHIGDAALGEQRREHVNHVVDAIARQQRAAKAFGLRGIERRRERQPHFAFARGLIQPVHADDRAAHRALPDSRE